MPVAKMALGEYIHIYVDERTNFNSLYMVFHHRSKLPIKLYHNSIHQTLSQIESNIYIQVHTILEAISQPLQPI